MAIIHMIFGPVGAGKTTHALKLAKSEPAIHFSIDEWMRTLFTMDASSPPNLQWMLERTQRCEAQIWKICAQLLPNGIDVIVDLGFMRRDHRTQFRAMAREAGIPLKLHYITADAAVRRERVRSRNQGASETFTIEVSDVMFDWAENWFEAPEDDELEGAEIVVNQ